MNKQQDEISAARRKKRRKVRFRRLSLFVAVLSLLLIGILVANALNLTTFLDFRDGLVVFFTGGGGYPVDIGELVPLQVKKMSGACAIVTRNSLLTFTSGGSELMNVPHSYLMPCIDASGNRIVLYNVRSRDVSVYNRTGLITSFQTQYSVIDAKIASNGTLAVLSESERYTCQMEVYRDGRYERVFAFYLASGFPIGITMSDNGGLVAAARLVTDGGSLYTVIATVDVRQQQERYEQRVPGMLLKAYFAGDALIAVTDSGAYRLSASGELEKTYFFDWQPVLNIACDEGQDLAIAFGENTQSGINSVVILSPTLDARGLIEFKLPVKDMYLTSDRLYLLSDQRIYEFDHRAVERRVFETPLSTRSIVYIDGIVALLPDRMIRINKPIEQGG